jgi:hypothetical protein
MRSAQRVERLPIFVGVTHPETSMPAASSRFFASVSVSRGASTASRYDST